MQSQTHLFKRRSTEKMQPCLPKAKPHREPSHNARTIYKELKSPSQQLKEFHKKELKTIGNLSTQKSFSNLNSEQILKQSRFDDDHHNTQSMAQLLQTKNNSSLQTGRIIPQQRKQVINLSTLSNYKNRSSQVQSLESEYVTKIDSDLKDQEQKDGENVKEGQNYDDYVLGDKAQDQELEEEQEKKEYKLRKYASDHKFTPVVLGGYQANSQSQLRMEQLRIFNQRKKLNKIKQDREILALMQEYTNNKRNLLNQSNKKHEMARVMALNYKNSKDNAAKIEKSLSLPALKPKIQVNVIPEESHYQHEYQRNIIGKSLDKKVVQISGKGRQILTYGKLGFGRKKIRTICEEQIKNEQMETLQNIKDKLRSKGISFDANKLKKGLVNNKFEPQFRNIVEYPQLGLPSNPIYKKFPL